MQNSNNMVSILKYEMCDHFAERKENSKTTWKMNESAQNCIQSIFHFLTRIATKHNYYTKNLSMLQHLQF